MENFLPLFQTSFGHMDKFILVSYIVAISTISQDLFNFGATDPENFKIVCFILHVCLKTYYILLMLMVRYACETLFREV